MLLCTLQNIFLTFGTKELFKGTGLTIHEGDRIGLLGLNGHGKSTLFRVLNENLTPDHSTPPFIFDKASGYSVFLVPQDLPIKNDSSLTIKNYLYVFYPKLGELNTKLESINEKLGSDEGDMEKLLDQQKRVMDEFEHLGGWELTQSYESYLKYFGLIDFEKKVMELSGGEQKKILLSVGFSNKSKLTLWDEPTNHLDVETIKLFENELDLRKDAFMLVSHDRYLLSALTNKIYHIQHGKIEQFKGNYAQYLEHLQVKEEERLKTLTRLKNKMRRETEWMRQGIKARGTRSKKRVENYHELQKNIEGIAAKAKRELELEISASKRKSKKLIELIDIGFSFPGKTLFSHLNLLINKGDKIGLIGPNGVGKSTLMKIISEQLKASSGSIKSLDGVVIQNFTQKREELKDEITPAQLIGEGNDFVELPDGRRQHVSAYFESFLFNRAELHRPLKTFSGGEKTRLQLALNLKKAGDLWIFDEPTNDLDLETIQILEDKLLKFNGSLILISHDRAFLSAVTNKVWLMEEGNFEVFEAGYSQTEAYLEAREIKKSLEDDAPKEEMKTIQKAPKRKLSNKEKDRLKKLPREIDKAESKLGEIEQSLAGFDFSTLNETSQKEYEGLVREQKETEESILLLYEELELLDTKF